MAANYANRQPLFQCRNLDALQHPCSRDPTPPLLRAGSGPAQLRLRSAHPCSRTAAEPRPIGVPNLYTIHNLCQPELIPRQLSPSACLCRDLWLRILKMSISLLPLHLPSLLLTYLSSYLLSCLSSKIFFSRSYLHPRMQNSVHYKHQASKRTLERT